MPNNFNSNEQEVWKSTFKIAAPIFLAATLAVIYMIAGYNVFLFKMPEQPSATDAQGRSSRDKTPRIKKSSSGTTDKKKNPSEINSVKRLSDVQIKTLTEKMLEEIKRSRKDYADAQLNPLVSSHPDHYPREIKNPFKDHIFWSVLLEAKTASPNRMYMAVSRRGKIYYPYTARDFKMILKREDTSQWDDDAYYNAALLFVHIASPTSQDGWRVLRSPRDFLKIIKPKVLTREIALAEKEIHSGQVKRENNAVIVEVSTWHWAGGITRKWIIQFGDDFSVKMKDLGAHGGGTYEERLKKAEEEKDKKPETDGSSEK